MQPRIAGTLRPPPSPNLSTLDERLYRSLYRIRRVEEEIARAYPSDEITTPVHLSIGQEAVSVAVCEALRSTDVAFGTYRSHAVYLAKGGDLDRMIAELYGRATGVAGGKAGSMHLIDRQAGVLGASAVVGSTLPLAVGYALAASIRGTREVVVCFFGEGATEEGVFHESLNFAALRKLPVLFVCENNSYAIHISQAQRQARGDICAIAQAHGWDAQRFDALDVYRLYAQACQAIDELRAGRDAPVLLECACYRWREHVGPEEDFDAGYRSRQECEPWRKADVLVDVGERLKPAMRSVIESRVEKEIQDAFEFARASQPPQAAALWCGVFAE